MGNWPVEGVSGFGPPGLQEELADLVLRIEGGTKSANPSEAQETKSAKSSAGQETKSANSSAGQEPGYIIIEAPGST